MVSNGFKIAKKYDKVNECLIVYITTPKGKEARLSVSFDASLLIHAVTGDTRKLYIGCCNTKFKITELNENGSVYSVGEE